MGLTAAQQFNQAPLDGQEKINIKNLQKNAF
jgi:hypothetical protein